MSTNVTPTYPQTPSKPIFSPGSNVDEMKEALEELLDEANRGGNWRLTSDKMGLQRSFKFKGFNRCWDFMHKVANECKINKHHPEWSNIYNTTYIVWTTHSPRGLSHLDIRMANICDTLAIQAGEVLESRRQIGDGEESLERGKALIGSAKMTAGDCCVPKSSNGM